MGNEASLVAEGPRATRAVASSEGMTSRQSFTVSVDFVGGSDPFYLKGTRNCTTCCDGVHTVDLDASHDGQNWVNGTAAVLSGKKLTFKVELPSSPKHIRHTAASIFPQCALYNHEGLPALPFQMDVQREDLEVVV